MEYQWIDCYSIGTNCTIDTNGRVECTPTQFETIANYILNPHNEMHFTNEYQWIHFLSIGTNHTNGTNG